MFINNIQRGDRIVFVDDVISTGGTLLAIVKTMRTSRRDCGHPHRVREDPREGLMEKELGIRIKTLLKSTSSAANSSSGPKEDPPRRTPPAADPDPASRVIV